LRTLDSSILIDFLRDLPAAKRKLAELEQEHRLVTTEVGAFELYLGVEHLGARRRERERGRVKSLLEPMDVLPLERRGAIRAAEIAGEVRRRGRSVGLADLLTAAIALGHGGDTIVTRDVEDFRRVPGIRVETY